MTAAALGVERDFTDRGKAFWACLRDHYEADAGLEAASVELLKGQLQQRHPRLADDYTALVDGLDPNPPVENLQDVLVNQRRDALARDMAIALAEREYDRYHAMAGEFASVETLLDEEETLVGTAVDELLSTMEAGNRIPILSTQQGTAIRGGLLPGHNALIYGRPEMGKSAFAINCLRHAAAAGYRVGLWENEDPLATTQLRVVQSICNATEDQVRVNAGRYRYDLEESGYFDRIFFRESPDGTLNEIEHWVERHQLDLVIINQMVNLRTQADSRVLELSQIARGQRALAKRQGCAVIGVAQAGESAIGRSILRLEDLEWSNTGVQATLDLMMGLSMPNDPLGADTQRTLALPKNKLGANHNTLMLQFDAARSRME